MLLEESSIVKVEWDGQLKCCNGYYHFLRMFCNPLWIFGSFCFLYCKFHSSMKFLFLFQIYLYYPYYLAFYVCQTDFVYCVVQVPIVPYGGATSIEGHTLAPNGGLCIDMSLMNVCFWPWILLLPCFILSYLIFLYG